MTDSADSDSDSMLGAALLMEIDDSGEDETEDEQTDHAPPLIAVRLPPPRSVLADPLLDVIESNLVFNSLVRMIYGSEMFDPTDYFDFDDYPRTPVSRQWLDQLPPPAGLVQEMCTICLGEVDEDSVQLPCNHVFHRSCLEQWFERRNTCPVCRVECACATARSAVPSYYEVSTNRWSRHIRHLTIADIEGEIEQEESSEPEGAVEAIILAIQQNNREDEGPAGAIFDSDDEGPAGAIFDIDDDGSSLSEQELREQELRDVVSGGGPS